MLKARKANRVLKIPDEKKKTYIALGYTITDMDGNMVYEHVEPTKKLEKAEKEIADLKAELEEASKHMENADKKIGDLENENAELKKEIADLKAELEEASDNTPDQTSEELPADQEEAAEAEAKPKKTTKATSKAQK